MNGLEAIFVVIGVATIVAGGIGAVVFAMRHSPLKFITINEWEHAVRFDKGKLKGRVEPGQYWYLSFVTSFYRADARRQYATIAGQEILTSDAILCPCTPSRKSRQGCSSSRARCRASRPRR